MNSTQEIKEGSKVRVVNCDEWAEGIGKHRAIVRELWDNGKTGKLRSVWAKLSWLGTNSKELESKYGRNFNVDELRLL